MFHSVPSPSITLIALASLYTCSQKPSNQPPPYTTSLLLASEPASSPSDEEQCVAKAHARQLARYCWINCQSASCSWWGWLLKTHGIGKAVGKECHIVADDAGITKQNKEACETKALVYCVLGDHHQRIAKCLFVSPMHDYIELEYLSV